jgi:hypothetical protein
MHQYSGASNHLAPNIGCCKQSKQAAKFNYSCCVFTFFTYWCNWQCTNNKLVRRTFLVPLVPIISSAFSGRSSFLAVPVSCRSRSQVVSAYAFVQIILAFRSCQYQESGHNLLVTLYYRKEKYIFSRWRPKKFCSVYSVFRGIIFLLEIAKPSTKYMTQVNCSDV